jgi:formate C-acetyltransferase
MLPYYEADKKKGVSREEFLELAEEFFIMLNCDSDLYVGMQQGDNGQSMVLGGVTRDGLCAYNDISELALAASLELKLIDPKINLRVDKNTPLRIFELGTRLTREGLGFPQYNNDDVVIPGLIKWGYDPEDARDYVVAACWEPIIPGSGTDVNNIGALCLAEVVRECTIHDLCRCKSMDEFVRAVGCEIRKRCAKFPEMFADIYMEPAPVHSIFTDGCIEKARDCSLGSTYCNYGIHGTGIANAADSLAAIEELVFRRGTDPKRITDALQNNFEGYEDILADMRECPKTGNNDDRADDKLCLVTKLFADGLDGLRSDRGGLFRAGTGSAMFYITHGESLGATADGRKNGEWLSANYSPSLDVKLKGPLSVIHSFTKPDLARIVNGGPLTLELHDTVFKDADSLTKVAQLVRLFVLRGGHQLQLNTVSRERLTEAQRDPEHHRNLIVRVWGWSGYFVELDKMYQDHIIKRTEFQ